MKAPDFWKYNGLFSKALFPFSFLYDCITKLRIDYIKPKKSAIPVICIGNINLGGGGKTPTCIEIAKILSSKKVFFLSRGYKSKLKNVIVDAAIHNAIEVGDEPLLLSKIAPVIIASDRVFGADIAIKNNAEVIIMDDGFQNPHLFKDFSIIVVDGNAGFGNNKIFPAGPLRENLANGIKRANAIIMIGKNQFIEQEIKKQSSIPIFHGKIISNEKHIKDIKNQKVVAFAGIARPDKFYKSLLEIDANIIKTFDFSDHHFYSNREIENIIKYAKNNNAIPVTTAKDFVRISKRYQQEIKILEISLEIDRISSLENLIKEVINV